MGSLTTARWDMSSPTMSSKSKSQSLYNKNYLGLLSQRKIPRSYHSRAWLDKTTEAKEFPFLLSCQGGPRKVVPALHWKAYQLGPFHLAVISWGRNPICFTTLGLLKNIGITLRKHWNIFKIQLRCCDYFPLKPSCGKLLGDLLCF